MQHVAVEPRKPEAAVESIARHVKLNYIQYIADYVSLDYRTAPFRAAIMYVDQNDGRLKLHSCDQVISSLPPRAPPQLLRNVYVWE